MVNFKVTSSSNPGNVIVNSTLPDRFGFSASGNMFIPIGQNIPVAVAPDPNATSAGYSTASPDLWDANDNAFLYQRTYIKDLARHQGNFIRLHMDPWSNAIEWGTQNQPGIPGTGAYHQEPVICNYRQDNSWELDSTIFQCEQEGVYVQLTLESDQGIDYVSPYGSVYQWYDNADGGENEEFSSPYYYLLGGPSSNPDIENFFSSSLSQEYFKKRLFYMEARWGYSPNIALWELMNEADLTGYYSPTGNYEYAYGNGGSVTSSTFQGAVAEWTETMASYLRSSDFYPQHLVTMGYGNEPGAYDSSPSYLDVKEVHDYTSAVDENHERVTKYYRSYGTSAYDKPFILGELGNNACDADNYEDYSFHDAEWASAFITAGAGLYWDDWPQSENVPHRNNFPALSDFFSNSTVSSALNNSGWSSVPDWYTNNGVEYFCNNSSNGNQIGWCHNLSVNFENTGINSSYFSCWPSSTTPSIVYGPQIIAGLNGGHPYNVSFYNTYTGGAALYPYSGTSSFDANYFGIITISDWTFASAPNWLESGDVTTQPDYAYLAVDISGHRMVKIKHDSVSIVLPNDTVYLPMDSIQYANSVYFKQKNGKFSWDFGNGQTSTAIPFPKFIYYDIGNYPTMVRCTDPSGLDITKIYQTYIVLDSASKPHFTKPVQPVKPIISNVVSGLSSVPKDTVGFIIMPNPTRGAFTLFATSGETLDNIEIYDISGRLCFEQLSPKTNTFDISGLAVGLYIIKIRSGSTIYNKKLVKF